MRKARKALFGVLAILLLAAVAFAGPAGFAIAASSGGGSPSAAEAKKKCKKHRKRCRKAAPTTPTVAGPAWSDGRWAGHYAENAVDLRFNVLGGRLYTGAFDSFFIYADCGGGYFDPSAIAPVQAPIASDGNFSGSGVYTPGFGLQLPWQLSGHIAGTSITGGVFTVGPYTDTFGDTCAGTTHFTAQWFAGYTL
jgi:hypothetical protein